jgi:hypothetical protein
LAIFCPLYPSLDRDRLGLFRGLPSDEGLFAGLRR